MKADCVQLPLAHSHTNILWESVMHLVTVWHDSRSVTLVNVKYKGVCLSWIFRPLNSQSVTPHYNLWILIKESCLDFVFSMMGLSVKLWFGSVFLHTRSLTMNDMNCNSEDLNIMKDGKLDRQVYFLGQGFCTWMCCSESWLKLVLFLVSVSLSF